MFQWFIFLLYNAIIPVTQLFHISIFHDLIVHNPIFHNLIVQLGQNSGSSIIQKILVQYPNFLIQLLVFELLSIKQKSPNFLSPIIFASSGFLIFLKPYGFIKQKNIILRILDGTIIIAFCR